MRFRLMRHTTLFLLYFFIVKLSMAQVIGGKRTFTFLQAPNSGKIAALGGDNVSSFGDDPSMIYQNPALLNEEMNKKMSFSFVGYVPGVKLSSVQYVFDKSKVGTFGAGLTYMNYGKIVKRDVGGNSEGEFFANEFVIHGTKTFKQDNFVIGVTPKVAFSQISEYTSIATALDLGGTFNHPEKDFTVGLAIQNLGFQVKKYNELRENLPLNIVAGFTAKPKHMPLKFSVTAHHLQQFDIVYYDESTQDENIFDDDSVEYKTPITEKIFRHFTFGGEFILSKNFNLRIGYNYLRRRELRIEEKSGGAGFSFGVMVKAKAYTIDFTKTYLNYAGRPLYLTVNVDIDKLLRKQEEKIIDNS